MSPSFFNRLSLSVLLTLLSFLSVIAHADSKSDYQLSAGDSIKIVVFQNPELTVETRVAESGNITYPLIGELNVGGKTIRETEQMIAQGLTNGGFVQQPQVNIVLLQVIGNRIAVIGMVNRPGRYPLDTFNTRISEMLATAGGVLPSAGTGRVKLTGMRDGAPYLYELDLTELFLANKTQLDILVRGGDVMYILPSDSVSILGQVNRPGRYHLEDITMKITDVLALAGGIAATGAETVVLKGTRQAQPFSKEVDIVAMYRNDASSSNDSDAEVVMPGDQIFVHRAPTYFIYGEAQRPGVYRLERNMTVMQALAQGGGPTVRGTQHNVRLYRRNKDGVVIKSNPSLTDLMQAEDVLFVRESLF